MGFVKWILQSRGCGMGFAGWSSLSGGRVVLLDRVCWVGFAGSDEICWGGVYWLWFAKKVHFDLGNLYKVSQTQRRSE